MADPRYTERDMVITLLVFGALVIIGMLLIVQPAPKSPPPAYVPHDDAPIATPYR